MNTSRREWLALAALAGAAAWFAIPARRLSATMLDRRAREMKSIQLHHLVLAVVQLGGEDPGGLPTGEAARAALDSLETALVLQREKERWSRQALAVLDDAQLAAAQAAIQPRDLPRERSHPFIPTEMLLLESLLSDSFGSATAPAPPRPDIIRWHHGSPQDIMLGLLGLVESGEPPLNRDQARAVQAALLSGMRAHELQPEVVEALGDLLGERVLVRADQLTSTALDAGAAKHFAPAATLLLTARAQ